MSEVPAHANVCSIAFYTPAIDNAGSTTNDLQTLIYIVTRPGDIVTNKTAYLRD